MIHNLKPYSAYKDSGVPWLGEVPEHWEVVPNRAFLKLKKELVGTSSSNYTLLSLTKQGVIARDLENPEGKFPASFDTYQKVKSGNLIFCLFDIDETPRAVGLSNLEGMITGAYTIFECTDPKVVRFIYLFYLAMDNGKQLKPLYTGLRKVITKSTFLSAKMPLPPFDEQSAIVRYLDYIDRRIRRYIRAKQKLIKLLEEQKQAIIHQAVTRGLDPNFKLKPSGVEWLGDVPEHWEVLRSRYIFREVDDRSVTGQETHLSMSQKHGLIRSDQIETRRLISESYAGAKICACGDLVLNRLKAHLGVFALASERGIVSPDYTVLRPALDIIPSYFEFVYRTPACRVELRQRAKGIVQGFWRLYTDDFYQIPVPVPPKQEQEYIVTALEEKIRKIKEIITQTEIEISLLREYRARLIADVVTGKLDVREAAANLPGEAEETETFDDALAEGELENDEVADQAGELDEEVIA